MMNPDNTEKDMTAYVVNMDSIRNALSGESESKRNAYSLILVASVDINEAYLFLAAYFDRSARIIALEKHLLVLLETQEIARVAEALNIAFQENFFRTSTVLYMKSGRHLSLEEKVRILLDDFNLIHQSQRDYRIAASEDLTLLRLAEGLSDETRNRYLNDVVPYYKQLTPELRLTLRIFFAQDLSMSRTAKQLFIHRNTLTYRIGKILQITGLDIRRINEALILILSSYLVSDSEP